VDIFAKKHSPDRKVNPLYRRRLSGKGPEEGRLSCAVAFEIVKELDTSPEETGFTLDSLEIKIIKCQMGIFGYGYDKAQLMPLDSVRQNWKRP